MIEYVVVNGYPEDVIDDVQGYLNDGWLPCGGINVVVIGPKDGRSEGLLYSQALSREVPNESA